MPDMAGTASLPIDVGRETLDRMSKVERYNLALLEDRGFRREPRARGGSGTGNMSAFVLDRPLLFLTDLNPSYRADLERAHGQLANVRVLAWDLEKPAPAEVAAAGLDTIICLNVLEHVKQDGLALANMASALGSGGRLLLMVPAVKALYGTLDIHLEHHRRYAKGELLAKLRETGFQIEKVSHMNFFGMFGWFVNSRIFQRQILSTRQLFLFNKLAPLFIAIERRLFIPVGLSLVVIARRP
ncbi:MAG: methyltransferase [Acidobacteriota bacterium]